MAGCPPSVAGLIARMTTDHSLDPPLTYPWWPKSELGKWVLANAKTYERIIVGPIGASPSFYPKAFAEAQRRNKEVAK